MAKNGRPRDAQAKNSKEFVVWSVVLTLILFTAGAVLWGLREDTGRVHIPENAFEDVKSSPERFARDSAPNAVIMPRQLASDESQDRSGIDVPEADRSIALQQAMDLVDRGQWNEAEPILLYELQKDPKNLGVLLELAMIQILDKNQPSAAVPYLEEALRVDPNNDSAMSELLNVYAETQNFPQADRLLSSLPVTDENRGMLLAARGFIKASAGDNVEAANLLKSAVYEANYPTFSARKDLAEAYESLGRAEEANHEYETIINGSYKPEQQRQAKLGLAKNYAAMKNYSAAYALLEGLISANPKDKYAARVLNEIQSQASR